MTIPSEGRMAYSFNDEDWVEDWCSFLDQNDELEVGSECLRAPIIPMDPGKWVSEQPVEVFIEHLSDMAYEEAGEVIDAYPVVSDEAKQELVDLLKAWTRQHCQPGFFVVGKAEPFLITEEDLK